MQKLLRAVEQALIKPAPRPSAVSALVGRRGDLSGSNLGDGPSAFLAPSIALPALPPGPQAEQSFNLDRPLREARDAFEKSYFEFHLAKENGSMTRVAEKTGLERTHLYRKLQQLGVDLSRNRRGGVA